MRTIYTTHEHRLAARWVLWRNKALFRYQTGEDELDLIHQLGLTIRDFEDELKRLPPKTRIVACGEPEYPTGLYDLERPPAFIYIRGATPTLQRSVAVVGTRGATFEDEALTVDFVSDLVNKGAHIISGGAIGVDIAAHRAALSLQQPTTVVLPGGVDIATPARHREDFTKVLEHGGTLISLQPLKTQAFKSMFAPRNALLAAIASSLVVVRSGPEGGTMITVDIAKRLGRPIYAIPGDPREKTSLGCLELLRSNIARPAWSANHVLGDLPTSRLSLIQQKIVNAIGAGRDHLDALMEDLDHECTEVHQAILELEFMGVITRLHGRYICAPMMLGELT